MEPAYRQCRLGVVVAMLVCVSFLPAFAQIWSVGRANMRASQYNLRTWTSANGFPSSSVNAVIQTRDGYIWMATFNGLVRFDGVKFMVLSSRTRKDIPVDAIYGLAEGDEGAIWAATKDGGLMRYQDDRITMFTTVDGLVSNQINRLHRDYRGNLWIGTAKGLQYIQLGELSGANKANKAVNIRNHDSLNLHTIAAFNGMYISRIFADSQRRIWIATPSNGIFRLDSVGLKHYKNLGDVVDCTEMVDGMFLVADRDKGIFAYRGDSDTFVPYSTTNGIITQIDHLRSDSAGGLWITSSKTIERLYRGERSAIADRRIATAVCSMQDREGNFWFGTYLSGLSCLQSGKFLPFGETEGLSNNLIYCVFCDADGTTWIGTQKGLNHLSNGVVSTFTTEKKQLPNDFVRDILRDRQGLLWLGTQSGLVCYDGKKFHAFSKEDGMAGDVARTLQLDDEGNLWIGSRKGIYRMSIQQMQQAYTPKSRTKPYSSPIQLVKETPSQVLGLTKDAMGRIWVATDGAGVYVLHGDSVQHIWTKEQGLASNTVFQVYEDKSGDIWMITNNGISLLHNGLLATVSGRDGLPTNAFFQMVEDAQGYFWMIGERGIIRIQKQVLEDIANKKRSRVVGDIFTTFDGLKANESLPTSRIGVTQDGTIWFPTVAGVAIIHPFQFETSVQPPTLRVEKIMVDSLVFGIYSEDKTEDIVIPPRTQTLSIDYTALSFTAPERVRFKYTLEGFDGGWIDAETRRTAYYTNLPPATYRFHVIACNGDGVWNEQGASIMLIVQPPWWMTWWFRGISFLSICASIMLTVRIGYKQRVRAIERRNYILEQQVQERTKELRDANTEIHRQIEIQSEQAREIELTNTVLQEKNKQIEFTLTELRSTQAQLIQAEKMAGLGQLTAGIAHEINNPINFIAAAIAPLRRNLTTVITVVERYGSLIPESTLDELQAQLRALQALKRDMEFTEIVPELFALVQSMENGSRRIIEIVSGLRVFSRLDEDIYKPADIHEGLESTLTILRSQYINHIEMIRDYGTLPLVDCYLGQLNQVFMNLLANAIQSIDMSGKKTGTIQIRTSIDTGAEVVRIGISDDGTGMSHDVQKRIFDPFFTTKDVGKGTGLGLSVVFGIIQKHKGRIEVESELGRGSTFTITLPLKAL